MYRTTRYESKDSFQLKLPWDASTAKGFGISLLFTFIFLFILARHIEIAPPKAYNVEIKTVPLEILNFGAGDGTGMSKGNLTREGKMHKGKAPQSFLDEAESASNSKNITDEQQPDLADASRVVPVSDVPSNSKSNNNGSGSRNVGSPSGTESGTGLGQRGYGRGRGLGLGDIEWGGGGNRIALYHPKPKYPTNINVDGVIKIRFVVDPDGTVKKTTLLRKLNPALDEAALSALKRWRFNRLEGNEAKDMVGVISLRFVLK